ncbi:DUF4097 family beta strand repeat-containing protein [Clostridium sp. DL1XJH146]
MRLKKYIVIISLLMCVLIFSACKDDELIEKTIVENKQEFSMDNINEILVSCNDIDINVISKDIETIDVELYGSVLYHDNKEDRVEAKIISNIENGEMLLEVNNEKLNSSQNELTLSITIPNDYNEDISINSYDSKIQIIGVNLKVLELSSIKSNIDLEDAIVKFIRGVYNEVKLNGNNVDTVSTSFDYTSGELNLKKFAGNIEVFSGLCDMNISYKRTDGNTINMITEEGNLDIYLPQDSGLYIDSRVIDGYVKSDFLLPISEIPVEEGLVGQYKDGENKVTMKTNKGNIKIMKN